MKPKNLNEIKFKDKTIKQYFLNKLPWGNLQTHVHCYINVNFFENTKKKYISKELMICPRHPTIVYSNDNTVHAMNRFLGQLETSYFQTLLDLDK